MKKINGIWWIFFAATLWSVQGVLGKANSWSPLSLTAVRAVFAAIVLGIYRKSFYPSKNKVNWISALFVSLTGLLFLSANNLTTAANSIVIQYVMPVFVMLLSFILWRNKISKSDFLCSIIMLLGVAICFMSGLSGGKLWGNILALLSAFTYASMFLSTKIDGCDSLSYTYQGCLISLLLLFYIPFDKAFVLSFSNIISATSMGLAVGLGYICFAKGFSKNVNPVNASIVSYIEPVLNPVWVMLFIGEKTTFLSLIGTIIVLSTAIFYSVKSSKTKE